MIEFAAAAVTYFSQKDRKGLLAWSMVCNNNNKFYSLQVRHKTKIESNQITVKTTSDRQPESQLAINAGRL